MRRRVAGTVPLLRDRVNSKRRSMPQVRFASGARRTNEEE
jgi:hypothetical protein